MFDRGDLRPAVNFRPATLSQRQQTNFDALMTVVYRDHPFFSFILLEKLDVMYTLDIPTAATDGFFIFINPVYLSALHMGEQVFAFVHEITHCIYEHMPRARALERAGYIDGKPFYPGLANIAQDARINRDLTDSKCGRRHNSWIWDPAIQPDESWEAIYRRYLRRAPKMPDPVHLQPPRNPDNMKDLPWTGASFDVHLPPPVDTSTNMPVEPGTQGMKETVLQAYGFAKAQGKFPAGFQRLIDSLRSPQIAWEDHMQFVCERALGAREQSWHRPHRRKLAMAYRGFQQLWPGRMDQTMGGVVAVLDTSGSMGKKELTAGVSEFAGVIEICRPAWFKVVYCDAKVHRVDEDIDSVEGLVAAVANGVPGGGGTDFRPVFDLLEREAIYPALMVFFTDGMGTYPVEAPAYEVLWVLTTNHNPPWGEKVRVRVEDD